MHVDTGIMQFFGVEKYQNTNFISVFYFDIDIVEYLVKQTINNQVSKIIYYFITDYSVLNCIDMYSQPHDIFQAKCIVYNMMFV